MGINPIPNVLLLQPEFAWLGAQQVSLWRKGNKNVRRKTTYQGTAVR
jgi:hypothetical protein